MNIYYILDIIRYNSIMSIIITYNIIMLIIITYNIIM